jgi:hypothetical protein
VAGLNEILEGGLNAAISRRLALQSPASLSLAPELFFSIDAGEMPELLYHEGWRRWGRGFTIPALAANFNEFVIRVVVPNALVVIERIVVTPLAAAAQFRYDCFYGGVGFTPLANNLLIMEFRDGRQRPGVGASIEINWDQTAAAASGFGAHITTPANTPVEIPGAPWVLFGDDKGPTFGDVMTVGCQVANIATELNVVWRERSIRSGEGVG